MVTKSWHRVMEVGRKPYTQHLLCLPKGWCDGVGIEKGTPVEVVAGRVLVVVPPTLHGETARIVKLMMEGL